jgi:hypothetical protein
MGYIHNLFILILFFSIQRIGYDIILTQLVDQFDIHKHQNVVPSQLFVSGFWLRFEIP